MSKVKLLKVKVHEKVKGHIPRLITAISRRYVPVGVPLDLSTQWSGTSYRSITEYRLAS